MGDGAAPPAAAPARPKKDGGFGLGKVSGFGTMYHPRFAQPFQEAVQQVVDNIMQKDDIMQKDVMAFYMNKPRSCCKKIREGSSS